MKNTTGNYQENEKNREENKMEKAEKQKNPEIKNVKKIKLQEVDLKSFNIDTIKGLYFQYKEIINYLVFGGLSTVVNFISYFIFARLLSIDEVISSGLSWFCAVLFAYITNKLFVFESKTKTKKDLIFECVSFFGCRVISGILCDVGTFALMVRVLKINDIIAKLVTQIMVIIVNYVFSKVIIFKEK